MKFVKIFKQISRFRLINTFLGSYLEVFLTTVSKLYPLGQDEYSVSATRANTASRGKLDLYRVNVISIERMAIQYAAYFICLIVRIYRSKILKYARSPKRLYSLDQVVNRIGEQGYLMVLVIVGIDLFFYSLRCVSHMDRLVELDLVSDVGFLLSVLTIVCISYEFISLVSANRVTTFASVRRIKRKEHQI